MGREDQTEEREVLDSIFPDEITGRFEMVIQKTSTKETLLTCHPTCQIYPTFRTGYR
jgi:hypothetical protein